MLGFVYFCFVVVVAVLGTTLASLPAYSLSFYCLLGFPSNPEENEHNYKSNSFVSFLSKEKIANIEALD